MGFIILEYHMCTGNSLYTCISNSVNKPFLLLTDKWLNWWWFVYGNQQSTYYSLENSLNNLFLDSQLNYQHCLLTVDCNTVAIFKTSEIFDSHYSYGIPHPFGKCVQISVENITCWFISKILYLEGM